MTFTACPKFKHVIKQTRAIKYVGHCDCEFTPVLVTAWLTDAGINSCTPDFKINFTLGVLNSTFISKTYQFVGF